MHKRNLQQTNLLEKQKTNYRTLIISRLKGHQFESRYKTAEPATLITVCAALIINVWFTGSLAVRSNLISSSAAACPCVSPQFQTMVTNDTMSVYRGRRVFKRSSLFSDWTLIESNWREGWAAADSLFSESGKCVILSLASKHHKTQIITTRPLAFHKDKINSIKWLQLIISPLNQLKHIPIKIPPNMQQNDVNDSPGREQIDALLVTQTFGLT